MNAPSHPEHRQPSRPVDAGDPRHAMLLAARQATPTTLDAALADAADGCDVAPRRSCEPHQRIRPSTRTRAQPPHIWHLVLLALLALLTLPAGFLWLAIVSGPQAAAAAAVQDATTAAAPTPTPVRAATPSPSLASAPLACDDGNRELYGRSLIVEADEWICGDANAYGGSVTVLGHVGGNVAAFGGSVTVAGEVDGNVTAFGGSVSLLSGARVGGDVQTWGGSIHREPQAVVLGNVERGDRMARMIGTRWLGSPHDWTFAWPWLVAWSLLAAIVVTLFPERTARVRVVARHAAVRSAVVGLLTAVLGVALAAVLFATCIGIPISLLVMGGLLAGWVLGTVAVGLWLGEQVVHAVAPREQSPLLKAVVGVALLAGLETIPCLGAAIAVLASSLGLGAALLSRFGAHRSSWHTPIPAPPLPAPPLV